MRDVNGVNLLILFKCAIIMHMGDYMSKEYIMIGTSNINKDIYRGVLRPLDNYSFKPTGGFWACEKISDIGSISPWLDYLIDGIEIAREKDIHSGVIFTLKNDARILTIGSYDDVVNLSQQYPSNHHILGYYGNYDFKNTTFDYEQLSRFYDGVYIDYNSLISSNKTRIFDRFSVNSLLLFNLDCIYNYVPIGINVNTNNFYVLPYIEAKGQVKTVLAHTTSYLVLHSYVKEVFHDFLDKNKVFNAIDYDDYLSRVVLSVANTIKQTIKSKIILLNKVYKGLRNNELEFDKGHIVRNMVLDCLSEYFIYNKEYIDSLEPSTITKIKRYELN